MSLDAADIRDKIRLYEKCVIPHFSELNQNNIENRPRHVHGKCRHGREHADPREAIERIEV